ILYVGLGRIVNAWLRDPTAAYVLLAVAFSGLTTVVVYLLARPMYDRATALAAASVLAVSPLFWFYGSVGLTYAGEALFASTVAYFAFRALEGSETDAWLAAAYLALAGGMRQSLLVLLFPLWLVACVLGLSCARRPPRPHDRGRRRRARRHHVAVVRADDRADRRARALSGRLGGSGGHRRAADDDHRQSVRDDAAHVALSARVGAGRA